MRTIVGDGYVEVRDADQQELTRFFNFAWENRLEFRLEPTSDGRTVGLVYYRGQYEQVSDLARFMMIINGLRNPESFDAIMTRDREAADRVLGKVLGSGNGD